MFLVGMFFDKAFPNMGSSFSTPGKYIGLPDAERIAIVFLLDSIFVPLSC